MRNNFWHMLASIRNGHLAKRSFIYHKKKKLCESFLRILWDEGFIIGYKTEKRNGNVLKIFLKYTENKKPAISSIKTVSKPGRRTYYSLKQIWKIDSTKNFMILSTDKGLKTIVDCKKLRLGGEPLVLIN